MGPVRQNPIQRTVSLFICVCIALCTIVAHNIAQNRPDSFPPYPPDNHHISDDVYLREGKPGGRNRAVKANWLVSRVCWPALLPFNVDRFWRNLVTRTLLWSSLAATIMVQIGRRGTARRLFENFKKILKKSQNSNFKILVHPFLRLCLPCIVKKNSTRF